MYPNKDIFFDEFRDNSFGYGLKQVGIIIRYKQELIPVSCFVFVQL